MSKLVLEIIGKDSDKKCYLLDGKKRTPILFWNIKIDTGLMINEFTRWTSVKIRGEYYDKLNKTNK